MWEQRTAGAGGGGEEGRLRFSFVDQKEQRRKAAAERGVCTPQIGAGCLWEEGAPSLSMALKKALVFSLLSQTCASTNPSAP